MYHCYSDARAKMKRCSFGVIVVNRSTGMVTKKSGVFPASIADNLSAEIAAMNIAASMVPNGEECVINHDLVGLAGMVDSYNGDHPLMPHLDKLRRHIKDKPARIIYDDRENRTDWYKQCHKMAHQEWNRMFRPISKSHTKVKKEKKPKTRWIIRRV